MISRWLLPLSVAIVLLCCFTSSIEAATPPTCNPAAARFDCGFGDQNTCEQNNCCWNPVNSSKATWKQAHLTTTEEDAFEPNAVRRGTPYCYTKQSIVGGYSVTSIQPFVPSPTQNPGWAILLHLYDGAGYFGTDIPTIAVDVTFETQARIRVKVYDPNNQRWEIPENLIPLAPVDSNINVNNLNYAFSYTNQPFGFAITRVEDGEVIFNSTSPITAAGPLFNGLIFSDQYLELSTSLPNTPAVYGLGEKVTSLQLAADGNPITFWARDAPSPPDQNVYGSHPFYLENRFTVDTKGNKATRTHGVWLRNSNGMDVVLQSGGSEDNTGYLTYRVIGGVLDFHIYVGNTWSSVTNSPEDIVRQYHTSVGFPHMPPFWSLGFHICRWGYPNLQAVETVVTGMANANIPLDTAWTDIDYMDNYEDFSTDPVNFPASGLSSFIDTLHSNGQHYVVIIDPAIHNRTGYNVFDSGLTNDVFIKRADGSLFVGKVWPGFTAFPSFYANNTQDWWTQNIDQFRQQVPVDGLWIDMNEASNFCTGECAPTPSSAAAKKKDLNRLEVATESFEVSKAGLEFDPNNPPYRINNGGDGFPLNTLTLDADALHGQGYIEYNVHNMYGFSESMATRIALETTMESRAFVLSRSTFSGSGVHAGHWLGDNWSTFTSMTYSIAGILAMNMFGIPLAGADICGFNGNTNEELCARWMALGSFYPFSRNHNAKGSVPQEPYIWPSVTAVSQLTLGARYALIHVYNTLFFHANQQGGTVARPVFFTFANDPNTWAIDQQFMIGSAILITPVLTQGATTVTGYFPAYDNDGNVQTWYDLWTFEPLASTGSVTLNAPISTIPVHIRGGTILPLQHPASNTGKQLANNFYLLIAPSSLGTAEGDLFLDDGLTLSVGTNSLQSTFSWSNNTLQYSMIDAGSTPYANSIFDQVLILGIHSPSGQVSVEVNGVGVASEYDAATQLVTVTTNVSISVAFNLVLTI